MAAFEREVAHSVHRGRDETQPPAEQRAQPADADSEPQKGVVEQQRVPAVGRQVLGIALDGDTVARHPPVEDGVRELHAPEADQCRRMWVALEIREGVVLAVDRHPLAGPDAGHQPDEQPEDPAGEGPQAECPVGERPVKEDRRAEQRQLAGRQPH